MRTAIKTVCSWGGGHFSFGPSCPGKRERTATSKTRINRRQGAPHAAGSAGEWQRNSRGH